MKNELIWQYLGTNYSTWTGNTWERDYINKDLCLLLDGWNKDIQKISREEQPKKEQPMKTLYHVIVVTKKEKIILDEKTVAEDEDEAKFNVDVADRLKGLKLKPKDVTVICNEIGDVKVEKEPQKVEVIKEK